uniref:Uncharacterized protein n=1 Tax=Fagus sylvatica TaxID=28930 RepID=A0A2N9F5B0_FAGSY
MGMSQSDQRLNARADISLLKVTGRGYGCGSGRGYGAGAWIWVQNFAGNSTGAWRRMDGRMVLKLWEMEDMVPGFTQISKEKFCGGGEMNGSTRTWQREVELAGKWFVSPAHGGT